MTIRTWGFLIREALIGVRRNGYMSLASASTVSVCLVVLAVFLLLAFNLENVASVVESQVEVTAFLQEGLPEAERAALERRIAAVPGVDRVTFVSKEAALDRLRDQLGADQGILEAVAEMNPLPDAFEVRVRPESAGHVAAALRGMRGIERIRDKQELVSRLLAVTRGLRFGGLGMAALLAFATIFVVANTIRLAVFARRSEIIIMRLVGATDAFIAWPFVLEGAILGLAGAAVAALLVWQGYGWAAEGLARAVPFLPVAPVEPLVSHVTVGLFVLGIMLGAVGSAVSVRRHLRV